MPTSCAVRHDGHVNLLHDGHMHYSHAGHVDHKLHVSLGYAWFVDCRLSAGL